MAFHAVDDIDAAFEATKAFLLPVDAGRWLRLAFVVFFLGGAGVNFPSGDVGGGFGGPGGEFPGPEDGFPGPGGGISDPGGGIPSFSGVGGELLALVLVAVALVVLVGLLFGLVGAVMEFVLVESLRTEEVHVRRYARGHLGNGLRLFGFRLGLTLLALLVLAVALGALFVGLGGMAALERIGSILLLVLLGIPLVLVVGAVYALVNGFTTTFVVPVMIRTDRPVLGAWRRFWRVLREEWTEYLVYAVFVFVLHLVVGTALALVMGIVAAILFVPLAIVGVVGLLVSGGVSPVAILPVVAVGGILGLAFLALSAVVRVPVVAFFRYYALLVLGDTDGDLDLIPKRREDIRA